MALPKIDVPIYEVKLVSTGKPVRIRPFLVKEQKLFLMASESDDPKETISVIRQVLKNCVLDEIDIDNLPNITPITPSNELISFTADNTNNIEPLIHIIQKNTEDTENTENRFILHYNNHRQQCFVLVLIFWVMVVKFLITFEYHLSRSFRALSLNQLWIDYTFSLYHQL